VNKRSIGKKGGGSIMGMGLGENEGEEKLAGGGPGKDTYRVTSTRPGGKKAG